ncbi:MAG TPA: ATP-binding protein, partial [Kofleriaceae bacterium]
CCMGPGALDQVIEAMVDVVLVVDVQGRIVAANTAAVRVTGYDREALAALPAAELIVDEESGLRTVVRERVSHGTPLSRTDSWLVARGGVRLPVSVTAAPIVDSDGVATSIVVVARDVRAIRELAAERDAEIERRATLGTLAGGVGHELRNIAQLYAGQLDALEHEIAQLPKNAVLDQALVDLARIGQHVTDHARRLMELARPGPSHAQRLNINRVIGEVVAMLQGAGRLSRVDTELALEDHPVMVTVNATRIEQILVNLVINAVQAMPNGGKLLITARSLDSRVEIQINDTGDGIAADVVTHIFEPFFTTRADGTGLGLPVVKEIVESYGGTIDVDSTRGIGTTFRFDLPLSRG